MVSKENLGGSPNKFAHDSHIFGAEHEEVCLIPLTSDEWLGAFLDSIFEIQSVVFSVEALSASLSWFRMSRKVMNE